MGHELETPLEAAKVCRVILVSPCMSVGSTQRHWPFPEHRMLVGYAYLFTHPGMPCVFWDHLFQHNQVPVDLQ